MKFFARQAPYWRGADNVTVMMLRVLAALVPVFIAATWSWGAGILINLAFACCCSLLLEALMLRLRGRPLHSFLTDGSALVTAALIAVTLPPLCPWWVTATACVFAIVFAKHLYGGLGYNPFNPAMVGYTVALVAFPHVLTYWPAVGVYVPTADVLQIFLFGELADGAVIDAYSSATVLDSIKMQLAQMSTMREITSSQEFGMLAGRGWEWINVAALIGGLWLIKTGVIRWHIPVAMLGAMAIMYFVFYALEPATHLSPIIGLLSGGTMLGAFFIATDPVSAAASDRGRLIYGAGIGVLCVTIRQWGAYPDGIAFAVLLMNMMVPLIDRYTIPRVYGYDRQP